MKNIICILMSTVIILLSLTACGGGSTQVQSNNNNGITSTTTTPTTTTTTTTTTNTTTTSPANHGFNDFINDGKLVHIGGYNLSKGYVYTNNFCDYAYPVMEFYSSYCIHQRYYYFNGEIKSYGTEYLVSFLTNNSIEMGPYGKTAIVETVDVTDKWENAVIYKVLSSINNLNEWWIPFDAIDWNRSPVSASELGLERECGTVLYLKKK